jgi:hypothetical protein
MTENDKGFTITGAIRSRFAIAPANRGERQRGHGKVQSTLRA